MEQFTGLVLIQDAAGSTTIRLDGDSSKVAVGVEVAVGVGDPVAPGGVGKPTTIFRDRVSIDGATGTIFINRTDGFPLVTIDGAEGDAKFLVRDGSGRVVLTFNSANAQLFVGATGHGGDVIVRDDSGREVLNFNSANAELSVGATGHGGNVIVRDDSRRVVLNFNSANAELSVGAGTAGNGGDISVRDDSGREVLNLNGANAQLFVGALGKEGDLKVRDEGGRDVLTFSGGSGQLIVGADNGKEGDLKVRDSGGREVFVFDGDSAQLFVGAAGNEGDVYVRNDNGANTIHLNGSNGDIILANADAAEDFELAAAAEAAPGAVMVLAGDGTVQPCTAAYDRKVVGVVAGAGSFRPAIVLDRRPGRDERRVPISVMGKAACRADAAYGAIEVGDLLTSSPTVGTAMRVADAPQAFGAVIGKALTPLRDGTGLVDMVIGLH